MDLTKKILNVSIAISIVLLSLSVFIYSIRDSKAIAKPIPDPEGYTPVGVMRKANDGTLWVVGYKYSLGQSSAKWMVQVN